MREIMDTLSPRHPAQRISFMKAAQIGATEAGYNRIGFVIPHSPGPMLAAIEEAVPRRGQSAFHPLRPSAPPTT